MQPVPVDALRLLNVIIDDQLWATRVLGQCLGGVVQATPEMIQDARYQRVLEYSRQQEV